MRLIDADSIKYHRTTECGGHGAAGRQDPAGRPPVWAEREAEMIYKVFVSYRRPGEGIRWLIFRAPTLKNANARVELIAESAIVYHVRIERCG